MQPQNKNSNLVNVDSGIVQRVDKLMNKGATRIATLCPGVTTGPRVAWGKDKLFRASRTDAVDSCLVVFKDKRCRL